MATRQEPRKRNKPSWHLVLWHLLGGWGVVSQLYNLLYFNKKKKTFYFFKMERKESGRIDNPISSFLKCWAPPLPCWGAIQIWDLPPQGRQRRSGTVPGTLLWPWKQLFWKRKPTCLKKGGTSPCKPWYHPRWESSWCCWYSFIEWICSHLWNESRKDCENVPQGE